MMNSVNRMITLALLLGTITLSMAKNMVELEGRFQVKNNNLHKSKMQLNQRMRLYGDKGKQLQILSFLDLPPKNSTKGPSTDYTEDDNQP